MTDAKKTAPAVARNKDALLDVVRRVFPASGTVLEVASGSGEHALYFARHLPALTFQPSDVDAGARASIEAWRSEGPLANLRAPLALDAAMDTWPDVGAISAVLNVNMIHIAPWDACLGLLRHAARLLPSGAPLVMYGPHRRAGVVTAPSNEAFDADLRRRNPTWGVRALEDVAAAADAVGLALDEVVEMPANNITAVYRRR